MLAGCTGAIGNDDGSSVSGPGGGNPGPGPSTTEAACTDAKIDPGPSPVRRLSRIEYQNTIRDLFGLDTKVAESFPADQTVLGFDNNVAGLTVTSVLAEQYMAAAEKLALAALPAAKTMAGCSPATAGETTCAKQLATKLARKAFRRPATDEQIASLMAAFAARKEATFDSGVESMLQLVLQSPYFLYRVELGGIATEDPTLQRIDDHDVASRLSYLLWNSMPDDALFAAADEGKLGTKEEIAEQARRMMKDPRARAAVANFHRQWMELDHLEEVPKDPKVYPEFDALRGDLATETTTFLDQVFWTDGRVETLFTAPYTYANAKLATAYGLPAPSGSGFVKIATDPSRRIGLLLQPSVQSLHSIAYESSPIYRGKFVREKILCHELLPPPEGLVVVPPEVDPSKSTRERYTQHSSDPACRGCHSLMDPIGFGFEHYDGMGKWRDKEGTHTIDARGTLTDTDIDGDFNGAIELSTKLAKSKQVSNCVVTHWFRFAYGRGETESDRCSVNGLQTKFASAKYDMRELLVELTQTDAFRFKKVTK
jgi:hypothetical protein